MNFSTFTELLRIAPLILTFSPAGEKGLMKCADQLFRRDLASCATCSEVKPNCFNNSFNRRRRAKIPSAYDGAVPVRRLGIFGIESQIFVKEHMRDRRQRHGRAGMTGVCLLHRIHRQRADGIDAKLSEVVAIVQGRPP